MCASSNYSLPELGNSWIPQARFDGLLSNSSLACIRCPVSNPRLPGNVGFEVRAGGSSTAERITHKDRQEVLWQEFFLDPTQWWDNRQEKRSPRHPDFRHKRSKEALYMDNRNKPAWVDSKLALWDSQAVDGSDGTTTSGSDTGMYRESFEVEKWDKLFEEGHLGGAVDALDLLVQEGRAVEVSLFYRVLKRCIAQRNLVLGRRVHALSLRGGHGSDSFLGNHIICMYASHGKLAEAKEVFSKVACPNTFMWASIIKAHAEHGQASQAVKLYRQMRESVAEPDNYVFVAVLKACAASADLAAGAEVHGDILASAVEPDMFVGNCLVDMYAKCGSLEDARRVFDTWPCRDVVTWTAMISGYAQNGRGVEALSLFAEMQQEGITPANQVTFVALLQACGTVGALHQGKQLHAQIQQRGLEADVVVGNCLVDMYGKCASIEDARRVFNRLPTRDVVTWTALLNAYAEDSDSRMALQCFQEMQQHGVRPDDATFACLLVACSHEGLVTEGKQYFRMMGDHGLKPTVEHYNCMVDLLGRSGHLDEAEHMLRTMPFESDVVGWTSLLSACKNHGDIDRGRRCFDNLIELQPQYSLAYVLLTHMYASVGRWGDVDRIESLRRTAGAKKKPARACIELNNRVHEFTVGEERPEISSKLSTLNERLKDGGHVPHTELVLEAMSESEKEDALCGHAEKLALAFGLLNTPDGTPLLVTKNLRMCDDCHSGTKVMSRLENREIIVRDIHRVHRFIDGSCSVGTDSDDRNRTIDV